METVGSGESGHIEKRIVEGMYLQGPSALQGSAKSANNLICFSK